MGFLQYITDGISRKLYSTYCSVIKHPGITRVYHWSDVSSPSKAPTDFIPYLFVDPNFLLRSTTTNSNGIPIRYAGDRRAYINPLYAAYHGMVLMRDTDNAAHLAQSELIIDFLKTRCDSEKPVALLTYSVDFQKFGVRPPWVSAITQAVAALLCLRMYLKTQSENHYVFAEALLRALEEVGAQLKSRPGVTWFEEYPGERASHVLNGHLFAVIAILEARQAGMHLDGLPPAQELIEGILKSYPMYRCGNYLRYSLYNYSFCNPHYVGLHSLLFLHLAKLTNQPAFLEIAQELNELTIWPQYFESVGAPQQMNPSSLFES